MPSPTPAAVADLLVVELVRLRGGDPANWRAVMGPVHPLPPFVRGSAHWAVIPGGSPRERTFIYEVAESLRQRYPHVADRRGIAGIRLTIGNAVSRARDLCLPELLPRDPHRVPEMVSALRAARLGAAHVRD